ncbi:MAG: Isochorismatase-like protein [Podila humilis]|nr:MAG: Isochorismatase-like protein [Podila humilis]
MSTTALLLIDNQLGFRDVTAWGTGASNPDFEKNVTALIAAFRDACAEKPDGQRPLIIHVQYRPVWTDHPLHVSKVGPFGANGEQDVAPQPPPDEIIMTSHGHSVFINTPLESILKKRGIKTLLIAGMATDLAVSTAVRTAQNLALTGKWGGRGNMRGEDGLAVDMARIILIGDATRAFGKAGVDAQTIHNVHVESLRDFAEVRSTTEVIGAFH